jgi:hypothetical protein
VALQGTIDTFELTEVVRLLAAGSKTGVLRLEGSRGSGRLWVNGGKVTATKVDHAPRAETHAEALFELLRFEDGSFTFISDELADAAGEPGDPEEILDAAEALLAEWRDIEAVVPTTRAMVTLRRQLSRGDVVLDKQRWELVATIGGGVTVATLGEIMDLGELPVSRAVKDLIELGVVELDATIVDGPAVEIVEIVDPEPGPVYEPVIGSEAVTGEPEPFYIETEADPARSTLDEFAADFGLSDPVASAPVPGESTPVDASPFGADDGFGDFGGEVNVNGGADDGSSGIDPLGDFSMGSDGSFDAPATPVGPEAESYGEAAAPFLAADNDAAEVARQLSNLSPAAARAVAAAAKATTDEEREAALAAVAQEGDEPIDRELLLRFLASVKS